MDPLNYIPLVIVLVLAPMAVLGRWLVLNSEMRNAKRTRESRELRARLDKKRFDRELTDEAMRAGAR